MALETNVILKSILLNVYKAKSLEEARRAIEVLLDKEDVALIREQSQEYNDDQKESK